ncbi:uncharacterized protein LOC111278356 [Durio zibethinus]|uniref:Uncharacterized protein LOC111278356 n=1 Tax=Durio zibethinus TaxID=66656 RepID=A0A6P5WX85_DURZI|nr:uncharacterized protein LOC111278356 [Durio zibethinus]
MLVWLTYLLADYVATVALSTLLKSSKEEITSSLVAFWAPFLLLHLGGPDTITAYSLEDNAQWMRHLFGLCVQVGVAFYVYFRFWTNSAHTFIGIPIFIAGINKYGERNWILRSANYEQFKNSLFATRKVENIEEEVGLGMEEEVEQLKDYLVHNRILEKYRYLHQAYLSFQLFKPLFSDLKLRVYKELMSSIYTLPCTNDQENLKLVATELGFLYDVLYTKVPIMLSPVGVILRCICFSSTVSALTAFTIFVSKSGYPKVDIAIAYLLLVGAILLEFYSAVVHVLSEWTMLWLTKGGNKFRYQAIASNWLLHIKKGKKVGMKSLAQHSLLSYCTKLNKSKSMFKKIIRIFDTDDTLMKFRHTTWENVDSYLTEFISDHIEMRFNKYAAMGNKIDVLSSLLGERGNSGITGTDPELKLSWTINEVEFTHSILLWHIATDILFYLQRPGNVGPYGQISKRLSDYMMYLLCMRPSMLPEGIGQVRHRETCKEAMNFLPRGLTITEAARVLFLSENLDDESRSLFLAIGGQRKSVFFDGCVLSRKLVMLVKQFRWDEEEKWKMIASVWADMLTYAASHCAWREHAKQLKQSKELLTHVALLMAHLGLSRHIEMAELSDDLKSEHHKPPWRWDKLHQLAYYLA